MTVGELIIFNSTIPGGDGTFLDHLQNIRMAREVINGIGVDVDSDELIVNISGDELLINLEPDVLVVDVGVDELNININTNIGVNI